jgi:hypothetical protein
MALLALMILLFWAFAPLLRYGFSIYDDHMYVSENPVVQAGLTLQGVVWAFTTTIANLWHPLTMISHMLTVQLFGLQPGMHHMVNLLLHAANTIILCLLLTRMTALFWPSFFTAALFALHPLHVESVVWISGRKDLLSAFFWLLAIWSYYAWATTGGRRRGLYLATLALLAAGLMSKPMVVTLPIVFVILDFWPLGRLAITEREQLPNRFIHLLKEKWPFFFLSLLAGSINLIAQEGGKRYAATLEISPLEHISSIFIAYVSYIGKTLLPVNLSVVYPLNPGSVSFLLAIAGVTVIVIATWLVIFMRHRFPAIAVGWFWYIITLLPVIGIVRVGIQSMADRYTYIPLIGLFMIVSWGGMAVVQRFSISKQLVTAACIVTLLLCTFISRAQVGYWRDDFSLFQHASLVTKDNWFAYSRLSALLLPQGRIEESLAYADRAIEIRHNDSGAYYNRGVALLNMYRFDEAEKALRDALHYDIGMYENDIQVNLGILYFIKGDMGAYQRVHALLLKISPKHAGMLVEMAKRIPQERLILKQPL